MSTMLWRRLDLPGHDACRLVPLATGWRLEGAAVFQHPNGPAWLAYEVQCDEQWGSVRARVRGWAGPRAIAIDVARADDGSWQMNGEAVECAGCVDLDLGFTPATNVLQLRRVALKIGDQADVPVAWCDVDSTALERVAQRYERRSPTSYWYESPRFEYRAMLEVNGDAFVVRYPDLWVSE